jgi:uncharacterized protein (DUF1499 family)
MFAVIKWLFIVALVLAVLLLLAGQLGLLRGRAPADLGVSGGKLKAPAFTPNSVSSQAALWPDHPQRSPASVAPLAAVGNAAGGAAGGAAATMSQLKNIVQRMPGCTVVKASGDYLYATCTTRLLKFTDDLELWWDSSAGVVQVRSASRIGRSDWGANRARVEAIRAQLASGAGRP